MPRVSVIIPAFNPGRLIDVAIESVVGQTFGDWELLVVDDGSTEELSRVTAFHGNVRLIRQDNHGVSFARNVGILAARGEYVAFLDQDDRWLPTKLGRQVAQLNADLRLGMSYTAFDFIDGGGRVTGPGYSRAIGSYLELLRGEGGPCLSTSVIRRTAFAAGLFDPFYAGIQDHDLFLKVARHFKLGFVPTVEAQYRWYDGNTSHKYMVLYNEGRNIMEKHANAAAARGDYDAVRAARFSTRTSRPVYGAQAYDHARSAVRRRNWPDAVRHIGRAAVLAPRYVVRSLIGSALRPLLPVPRTPTGIRNG